MQNLKFVDKDKNVPDAPHWVVGTYENRGMMYTFNAKVYASNSKFGINGGHVSKLWIKNEKLNKVVFNYDRGYDIGDRSKLKNGMLKELMEFLETFAIKTWS